MTKPNFKLILLSGVGLLCGSEAIFADLQSALTLVDQTGLPQSIGSGLIGETTYFTDPAANPQPGAETYYYVPNGGPRQDIYKLSASDPKDGSENPAVYQAFCNVVETAGCQSASKYATGATSLATTSSSAVLSNTIQRTIIDPVFQTRAQLGKDPTYGKLHVLLADLKYEHAEFRNNNNAGNVGGFTIGTTYDFNKNYSIGAIIPYDYLDFNNFYSHRTGLIGYAKGRWDLTKGLELSASVNANYLYTDTTSRTEYQYVTRLHTYGGGFSTRLGYDNGGDFLAAVNFTIQYNEDGISAPDNGQYLIKVGPSVGYRIGSNAVVKVFGLWNKDITDYQLAYNKSKDTDYFDVGLEGAYYISDSWQIKGGYKKALGLQSFDADSFYIGSSISF